MTAHTTYEASVVSAASTRNASIDNSIQLRNADQNAAKNTYGWPNVTPANSAAFQAAMALAETNHSARIDAAVVAHNNSVQAAKATLRAAGDQTA